MNSSDASLADDECEAGLPSNEDPLENPIQDSELRTLLSI